MTVSRSNDDKIIPPPLDRLAPYFLLVLAVFAVYGNVYDNAFVYDDESLILKNAFLHDWGSISSIFTTSITAGANVPGGFYRPLQILLYLVINQFFGLSLFAFHLLNITLHAGNACLVYLLGRRLRFRAMGAFFAALIWAVHPVHTEIIAYMSGTADPLYVFFSLLGVIALVPAFKPQAMLAAVPCFILALLSKEEAITFPLLAMSCIFLLDRERFTPRAYFKTWPLWLVAGLYLVWHKFFLNFNGFELHRQHDLYAASIVCRFYTFLATLPSYLGFILWPMHLHFDRNFPPVESPWNLPVLAGFAMVAFGGCFVLFARKKRALTLSWALLWFAAAFALHTGIVIPVNASLLEHWLYLPSIGLFLGVAQAFASVKSWKWQRRKPAEATLATIVAVILGIMTHVQITTWRDPETLYLNIFKNGEPSPHAHNNLGVEYALHGQYEKALEQYELSIELSGDTNAQAQHDLAITLLNGPNGEQYTQEAIRHLRRALEIDPEYYPSALALAALYEKTGDMEKSRTYREKAEAAHRSLTGQPPLP